jgi:hypothetical protein
VLEDEEHRHRCEVREWIRRSAGQGAEWAKELLAGIARKRGKAAAERLWRDIREQRKRGNEGAAGDWRA